MSGNLSVVAFEGELNGIIREYLTFGDFDRSVSTFEDECSEKGKPISTQDVRPKSNKKLQTVQNEMMDHFRQGKRRIFFEQWTDFLPSTVRDEDSVAQKLEFYLNIYFAVYPMKHKGPQSEVEVNMGEFKTYLETRGSTLSQTTEFLPFYALPFVPKPKEHPSYKELFSDTWIKDLEVRLDKFLTLALNSTPQPRLFDLYRGSGLGTGKSTQQLSMLQQKLLDAEKKTSTYMRRHSRVQADYHNLIGITADLVDALESTVQGKPITPEYLQQLCTRLFSAHMRTSVDLVRPGTAGEALRASVIPEEGPLFFLTRHAALRWRLTRSRVDQRDVIMSAYIQHDLLGCAKEGPYRQAIEDMLTSDNESVKQYTARLFNAFASLSVGRSYLALNSELMPSLMDNLRSEDKDSLTREMILGALQKLSLRRILQTQGGVIEWLVGVLEDNDSLSDYTLEYSVALLMNLCLRTSGKKRCAKNARQTLKVLSDLLGHDNTEILPYVNGALYSILAIPSIREAAKAMDMEEILRCFIKDGQQDMNRQIEFIIKQLNSNEAGDEYESDDEEEDDDDEEDQDALEADLDKEEMIRPQPGELAGESMLCRDYQGEADSSSKKRHTDRVSMHEPLTRPATPSQRRAAENTAPRTGEVIGLHHATIPRSGSRPNSQESGRRTSSQASDRHLRPSTKAMEKLGAGANVNEYASAFGSRPRIPRTPGPDNLKRPSSGSSRSSISKNPPQPQYSESGPRPKFGRENCMIVVTGCMQVAQVQGKPPQATPATVYRTDETLHHCIALWCLCVVELTVFYTSWPLPAVICDNLFHVRHQDAC
ncbi:lisH domain-containing protein ARMC9-like [Haliotis rubra]|uniref:lisH domain-containing protein ARMC9-like n=1 Tax=Haliotis rubra TaxID=36100 RepID=UPI001EE5FDA7|nr:lisH domain-containing protein ARMC9-like [Haliotis rubra]